MAIFSVKARGATTLVYLLFEHKSSQDRWLVLQLLIYLARIWAWYRQNNGDDCRLPMILPLVFYHGEDRWSQPLRLIDLCDAEGENLELFGPYQPMPSLILIDLSQSTEVHLRTVLSHGTALTILTVLLMKSIRGQGLVSRLRSWTPVISQVHAEAGGRQILELLGQYLHLAAREEVRVDELQNVLSDAIGPESEELIMNIGEKLIQQGKEKGLEEALAGILRTRFGEIPREIQALMDAADLEALQRYHDRAIKATSVSEVFAG
ncbi:MAG: Rpn family recombination-promoting nuclease/putative transposase [Planctomycetota bacterium]